MTRNTILALWIALLVLSHSAQSVVIQTVPVGSPGNADDSRDGDVFVEGNQHFGAVASNFRIAVYEVSNDQYVEFLNAKGTDDSLGLFNPSMTSDPRGGIVRSGLRPNYVYTSKPNMGDKLVNYVSWYDAVRFANWMHNGQGDGDTESGAYTLDGRQVPRSADSIIREPGAMWFLPTEDEWYKAAYYDPRNESERGPSGDSHYWLYPLTTDEMSTVAIADATGSITNGGAHVANYDRGADWNNQNGNVTTVGSAGLLSTSYFGTFDQGGNVSEWNETLFGTADRGVRGGEFGNSALYMSSTARGLNAARNQDPRVGFRLASIPEPTTSALAGIGIAFFLTLRWTGSRRSAIATVS